MEFTHQIGSVIPLMVMQFVGQELLRRAWQIIAADMRKRITHVQKEPPPGVVLFQSNIISTGQTIYNILKVQKPVISEEITGFYEVCGQTRTSDLQLD